MRLMKIVCPCCGKTIKIQVSDDADNGVVFDTYTTDDLTAKLSERGLEFGVTEGGENEDGE